MEEPESASIGRRKGGGADKDLKPFFCFGSIKKKISAAREIADKTPPSFMIDCQSLPASPLPSACNTLHQSSASSKPMTSSLSFPLASYIKKVAGPFKYQRPTVAVLWHKVRKTWAAGALFGQKRKGGKPEQNLQKNCRHFFALALSVSLVLPPRPLEGNPGQSKEPNSSMQAGRRHQRSQPRTELRPGRSGRFPLPKPRGRAVAPSGARRRQRRPLPLPRCPVEKAKRQE